MILLPSFNRPHLCSRFFQVYTETKSTLPGLLIVDKEDPCLVDYQKLELPKSWELVLTQSRKMGDKFRETWDRYKNLEYVIILNDDYVPKTEHWDIKVASAIRGNNIVSTQDNFRAPHKICGAIAISGGIYRALGWLFPEGVQHLYSDDAWETIATKTGCHTYLQDVVVEHDHVFKKQAQDSAYKGDLTHEQSYSQAQWDHDRKYYQEWLNTRANEDIQKITNLQPKTGVMIATTFHEPRCSLIYAEGLMDVSLACQQFGIHLERCKVENSSLLSLARDSLVDMFMKSRCQKLLMIDSDQGYTRQDFFRLLNSSRRIVAGVVPHKRFPTNLNFEPLAEDHKYFKDICNKSVKEYAEYINQRADQNGEIEVARSGTGFMMIDRSVFDIMSEDAPKFSAFDNDLSIKMKNYFPMGIANERFNGEDWFFCENAKKHKIPIYINCHVAIPHHGSFVFDLRRMQ